MLPLTVRYIWFSKLGMEDMFVVVYKGNKLFLPLTVRYIWCDMWGVEDIWHS